MKRFIDILWEGEISGIKEQYRWLVSLIAVFFVLLFSYQFTLLWHNLVYLGPGLGDFLSTDTVNDLIVDPISNTNSLWAWLLGLYVIFVMIFRASVMLWSYFGYEKEFGYKFPLHIIPLFVLVNAIGALSIPLFLGLIGWILSLTGNDFNDGWMLLETTTVTAHQWVMANVPTLVEMPAWLAIICVFMFAGFFHYWLHRLGHESRALWLLFHRPHHMSPNLCQMSTAAVFFALPLFIIFFLPYIFLFASISKLFYAEPLYAEAFILNSIFMLGEVFGHSDVFYNRIKDNRFFSLLGFTFSGGVYHYLHHSAEEDDAVVIGGFAKGIDRKVNMINIGGGFFFIWDKVFGTYKPLRPTKPRVGLIGCPELYPNPLRLGLSGIAQLIYEWRKNNGVLTRFKILFGPSDFVPPASKDFAIKE